MQCLVILYVCLSWASVQTSSSACSLKRGGILSDALLFTSPHQVGAVAASPARHGVGCEAGEAGGEACWRVEAEEGRKEGSLGRMVGEAGSGQPWRAGRSCCCRTQGTDGAWKEVQRTQARTATQTVWVAGQDGAATGGTQQGKRARGREQRRGCGRPASHAGFAGEAGTIERERRGWGPAGRAREKEVSPVGAAHSGVC